MSAKTAVPEWTGWGTRKERVLFKASVWLSVYCCESEARTRQCVSSSKAPFISDLPELEIFMSHCNPKRADWDFLLTLVFLSLSSGLFMNACPDVAGDKPHHSFPISFIDVQPTLTTLLMKSVCLNEITAAVYLSALVRLKYSCVWEGWGVCYINIHLGCVGIFRTEML